MAKLKAKLSQQTRAKLAQMAQVESKEPITVPARADNTRTEQTNHIKKRPLKRVPKDKRKDFISHRKGVPV